MARTRDAASVPTELERSEGERALFGVSGRSHLSRRTRAKPSVWMLVLLSSCGGAARMPPGYVAVHNTLSAMGLAQRGEIHEGSLASGASAQYVTSLEEGVCRTFVAFGGDGTASLGLRVEDEAGAELSRSHGESSRAAAQLCPERSGSVRVIVTMQGGQGSFVLASWSGSPRAARTEAVAASGLSTLLRSPCEQAAACCRAYIEAMGGGPALAAVGATCENYRVMPAGAEEGCRAATSGWRQALEAMGHEIPEECR